MKKAFSCSLCHNGILGGALYLEDDTVTYKTNKLTVDKEYKKITLPVCEIDRIAWRYFIFPIATFRMTNGKEYKFIIFNKKRFCKYFEMTK